MNSFCNYKRFSFYTVLIILSILSCEKEKDYPSFGLMTLSSISNSAFLASIDVKSTGEFGILDHGFYYIISSSDPGSSYLGIKKSLGSSIEGDTISTVLVPDVGSYYYNENLKMFARAYITDSRGTVYSDYVSTPVLKFAASYISPSYAGAGDTITITGSNFNTDISLNSVTFNNIFGEIVSATSNAIRVVVPPGIQDDYYWQSYIIVRVRSGNQTVELNSIFRLKPSPTGFSPSTGSWNQPITIYGSGLYNCYIYIDTREIGQSSSNSSYSFYIPHDFLSKKFKIYVKNSGELYEVPGGYFTMKEMDLSLSDNSYYPGQYMIIEGNGFNPAAENNKLFLGSHKLECDYAYSYLRFGIPDQFPAGTYSARVSNSADTVTLPETINIIRPVISDISKTSGFPGTEVLVTGTDLLNDGYAPSLSMGGYNFSSRQDGTSGIAFEVPTIPAGVYTLSAWYGSLKVVSPESFTVLEPIVNSITPSEGSPGTSVVISGEGFYESYNNSVYFGNINAPIMSLTDSQINVKVPDSLSAGVWLVKVYINGQKLSTTVNFTVL